MAWLVAGTRPGVHCRWCLLLVMLHPMQGTEVRAHQGATTTATTSSSPSVSVVLLPQRGFVGREATNTAPPRAGSCRALKLEPSPSLPTSHPWVIPSPCLCSHCMTRNMAAGPNAWLMDAWGQFLCEHYSRRSPKTNWLGLTDPWHQPWPQKSQTIALSKRHLRSP